MDFTFGWNSPEWALLQLGKGLYYYFNTSNSIFNVLFLPFRTGNVFGILFLLGLIGALVYLSSRTYKKEIVKASSQMLSSVTSTVQSMR